MTRHLLRLIWNRKRQNFLLTVEIFFSFLTLFGVVLLGAQYANNARHPVGYEVARVWSIGVDRNQGTASRNLQPAADGAARDAGDRGRLRRVHRALFRLELGQRHATPGRASGSVRCQRRHRQLP